MASRFVVYKGKPDIAAPVSVLTYPAWAVGEIRELAQDEADSLVATFNREGADLFGFVSRAKALAILNPEEVAASASDKPMAAKASKKGTAKAKVKRGSKAKAVPASEGIPLGLLNTEKTTVAPKARASTPEAVEQPAIVDTQPAVEETPTINPASAPQE